MMIWHATRLDRRAGIGAMRRALRAWGGEREGEGQGTGRWEEGLPVPVSASGREPVASVRGRVRVGRERARAHGETVCGGPMPLGRRLDGQACGVQQLDYFDVAALARLVRCSPPPCADQGCVPGAVQG